MAVQKGTAGSITLICGSMFSGKSEELIRLVRRAMHAKKRVQVFKSSLETRCDTTVIRTHDGVTFTAFSAPTAQAIEGLLEPGIQVVAIEEVQFFEEAIIALCQRLANCGVEVIAAGLDQDFRGLPFGCMPILLAIADNVLKLHAICKVCGREASRTQRLVDGRPASWNEPTILIGAEESYEARCRRCHRVGGSPTTPVNRRSSARGSRDSAGDARSFPSRNGHKSGVPTTLTSKVTEAPIADESQLEMFPDMDLRGNAGTLCLEGE